MWHWLKSNHQSVTSLAAMMVGVIALYVAWDQSRVMRDQQHGAAYPILQVDGFVGTTMESASLGITVSNHGVGPALIEAVTIYQNGERRDDMTSYVDTLPDGYDLSWSSLAGRAMAPDTTVTPIRIRWDQADISGEALQTAALDWDAWDLQVCYCSVFGRCWESSLIGGARASRVAMCRRDDTDVFENLGATASAVE
jgi:hypothetical protein